MVGVNTRLLAQIIFFIPSVNLNNLYQNNLFTLYKCIFSYNDFKVEVRQFTTSKNCKKKGKRIEMVDTGTLKVFTHSTLESGYRTKLTTNIINIFVLVNPKSSRTGKR